MANQLDRWARDHRRRKLKELRAKKRKWKTAEAMAEYMRVKLREESFLRRILPPNPINNEETRNKIATHLEGRLKEMADEPGAVG